MCQDLFSYILHCIIFFITFFLGYPKKQTDSQTGNIDICLSCKTAGGVGVAGPGGGSQTTALKGNKTRKREKKRKAGENKRKQCSKGRMLKGKVQSNILLIYFMSFWP